MRMLMLAITAGDSKCGGHKVTGKRNKMAGIVMYTRNRPL